MKVNEGQVDRILRIIIGLALLSMLLLIEGPMKWWGLIGLLPLGTAIVGFCPVYAIFGISTCGKSPAPPPAS